MKDEIIRQTYYVCDDTEVAVHIGNEDLNEEVIEKRKRLFFKDSCDHLIDELVEVEEGYPENDITDVTLKCDFYIVPKHTMDKLLRELKNE